jgi:hypothetical protein
MGKVNYHNSQLKNKHILYCFFFVIDSLPICSMRVTHAFY